MIKTDFEKFETVFKPRLKSIKVQTLILWGKNDEVIYKILNSKLKLIALLFFKIRCFIIVAENFY